MKVIGAGITSWLFGKLASVLERVAWLPDRGIRSRMPSHLGNPDVLPDGLANERRCLLWLPGEMLHGAGSAPL
jgi:hypothetical protein